MSADIVHLGRRVRRGLDVEALERDLAMLWKDAGEEHAVQRACLANLFIAASPGSDSTDLLEDLARLHPVRAVVVRPAPGRERGSLAAWVSATCRRRPHESTLVCSESIVMEIGPGAEALVPSALRSLALGTLPRIALVEGGGIAGAPWVAALGDDLDLVLADGATMAPPDAVDLWRRCLDAGAGDRNPLYRDLAWTRLGDWRRAIALPFDDPAERERLRALREVRFVLPRIPGAPVIAALMAGWLASRLGWRMERAGVDGFAFAGDGGPVRCAIASEEAGDDPARVRAVSAVFDGGGALRWRRLSAERAIVVETGSGEVRARLNRSRMSPASAVASEIHRHAPTPATCQALGAASRLLAGSEGGGQ